MLGKKVMKTADDIDLEIKEDLAMSLCMVQYFSNAAFVMMSPFFALIAISNRKKAPIDTMVVGFVFAIAAFG